MAIISLTVFFTKCKNKNKGTVRLSSRGGKINPVDKKYINLLYNNEGDFLDYLLAFNFDYPERIKSRNGNYDADHTGNYRNTYIYINGVRYGYDNTNMPIQKLINKSNNNGPKIFYLVRGENIDYIKSPDYYSSEIKKMI